MLSGADETFPDNCWDLLLPQCNITLNLLRASCIQPKLSVYAQIHGNFNYNKNPLAPAGCKSIIHDQPNERPTWANHGTPGFYVGPALEHYRNYRCNVPKTRSHRTSDIVEFFPKTCRTPSISKADTITMVLTDLQHILSTQLPSAPYLEAGTTVENKQLKQIHELPAVVPRVITKISDKNPGAKQTPTGATAPQKGRVPPRVAPGRSQQPPRRVASEALTEHTNQRNQRGGKNTRELYQNGTII